MDSDIDPGRLNWPREDCYVAYQPSDIERPERFHDVVAAALGHDGSAILAGLWRDAPRLHGELVAFGRRGKVTLIEIKTIRWGWQRERQRRRDIRQRRFHIGTPRPVAD